MIPLLCDGLSVVPTVFVVSSLLQACIAEQQQLDRSTITNQVRDKTVATSTTGCLIDIISKRSEHYAATAAQQCSQFYCSCWHHCLSAAYALQRLACSLHLKTRHLHIKNPLSYLDEILLANICCSWISRATRCQTGSTSRTWAWSAAQPQSR